MKEIKEILQNFKKKKRNLEVGRRQNTGQKSREDVTSQKDRSQEQKVKPHQRGQTEPHGLSGTTGP